MKLGIRWYLIDGCLLGFEYDLKTSWISINLLFFKLIIFYNYEKNWEKIFHALD